MILDLLAKIVSNAGLIVSKEPGKFYRMPKEGEEEQKIEDAPVEPDIVAVAQDVVYWLDVSVIDPMAVSYSGKIISANSRRDANGARLTKVAAVIRETDKERKYKRVVESLSRSSHQMIAGKVIEFVPAVFEATGAMGGKLMQFLQKMAVHASRFDPRSRCNNNVELFVRRAERMLAVTLAEGHARSCVMTAMRMATGKPHFQLYRQQFREGHGGYRQAADGRGRVRNRLLVDANSL